jgi:hypothetical protein
MGRKGFLSLQNGGEVFSRDDYPSQVSKLLRRHGLVDPDRFVCLAASHGPISTNNPYNAYGSGVIGEVDLERVIDSIFLVGMDDIQNIAVQDHPERCWPVSGTHQERCDAMHTAINRCEALNRLYPEVRVCRGLKAEDYLWLDPSQDLSLNLEGWRTGPARKDRPKMNKPG